MLKSNPRKPFITFEDFNYIARFNGNYFFCFIVNNRLEVWNGTHEDSAEVMAKYFASEEYANIQPFQEAIQTLESLKENYRFIVITSRSDAQRESTLNFLNTHYTNIFDDVIFTNTFAAAFQHKKVTKAFMMKQLNAQLLIDDSIGNVVQCAKEDINTILYGNYPWNRRQIAELNDAPEKQKFIRRAKHWQDVAREIEQFFTPTTPI